jgi:2,5-diketo-D-gluconate reductase A
MAVPTTVLNNGVAIPQLGFGTFQVEPKSTTDAVRAALDVGYRHIDTAQSYRNEKQVGAAVRASGVDRSEVFVTTKLGNPSHAPADAARAFAGSLRALDLEYIDLFLVHWPLPRRGDLVETWRGMEEIYASGRVRAIGVSNFTAAHLDRVVPAASVVPAVNQVELHPWFSNEATRAANARHGIATEAWAPLAQGRVLRDQTIVAIADRLGRTPAQVVLRWHLQRGDIIIPRTVTPARLVENFTLFDFELSDADVTAITAGNRDERYGPDPETFHPGQR